MSLFAREYGSASEGIIKAAFIIGIYFGKRHSMSGN